jgi:Ca2+-binding RTX toxin-like protein
MTDICSFTYEYGNGDRYSGQVYAADGTYSVGQEIFLLTPNITGNQGKYTITSVSNVDSEHYAAYEGYVYTNVYEDAVTSAGESGYSAVSGHAASYAAGYSGLGSESGNAYGDLTVRFSPYYQADLISPFSLTPENDFVYGARHDGNDTVIGAFTDLLQNDYVDGGEAIDTLIITGNSESPVEVYAGYVNQLNIPNTQVYNFENFDFSGFTTNVNFYGVAGTNNTFLGGSGTDTVDYTGLGAKVTLKAEGIIEKDGGGQDTVRAETIIGDIGFANAIDASSSSSTPIIVDLSSESLTVVGLPSGDATFTVKNFVDVTGSQLGDTITGNDQNNTFNGKAGDDFFIVSGGSDIIIGGDDIDTINYSQLDTKITLKAEGIIEKEGIGTDTVQVETIIGNGNFKNVIDASSSSTTPIIVDLSSESLTVVGLPSGDANFTVKNFIDITGSQLGDTITGNDQNNTFNGQAGDDSFVGSGGSDIIIGGDDIDTADYSQLDTKITLKAEGIIEKEGIGTDTVQVETIIGNGNFKNFIDASFSSTTPIIVDLSENNLTVAGLPSGDATFTVKNFVDVIGTQTGDIIIGSSDDNTLDGQAGDDEFFGTDGSDTIIGGDGFDSLDYTFVNGAITLKALGIIDKGDLGTDIVQVESITSNSGYNNVIDASDSTTKSINVDLAANLLTVTDLGSFNVFNFKDVIGTSLADSITGNDNDNYLDGKSDNDILIGGSGDDILIGGIGADTLEGNSGIDTASYAFASAGISVNLTTGKGTLNEAKGDILLNIENVTGSAFADNITGNNLANILDGGVGADILSGAGGNDSLLGGDGNDNLTGGLGADTLNGGNGTDTASYSLATSAVTVNLTTGTGTLGEANGDVLFSIENLTGSSRNDSLTGDNVSNVLVGNSGNDTLNGGAGQDALTGGAGNDTHIFQFGQSTVTLADRITDFAFGIDKIDLLTQGGLDITAPLSFSRATNNAATTLTSIVTSVFADANGALGGLQALGMNSAALVVATNTAIAGTYLVVNDGTAGFVAANDLVVNLTGYTGTLPSLGNITPTSVFV